MVKPAQESPVDRVLADRLAAEIKKLIAGRSVAEAVALLTFVNHAISQADAVSNIGGDKAYADNRVKVP